MTTNEFENWSAAIPRKELQRGPVVAFRDPRLQVDIDSLQLLEYRAALARNSTALRAEAKLKRWHEGDKV